MEGIHVCLWLIHIVVWQKPTQHCKAIILQLKINLRTSLVGQLERNLPTDAGNMDSIPGPGTFHVLWNS